MAQLAFSLDFFKSLFEPLDLIRQLLDDLQQLLALRAIGIVGRYVHDHQHGRFTSNSPKTILGAVNKHLSVITRIDR